MRFALAKVVDLLFLGDHHQHVVSQAHVLAIQQKAAAVVFASSLLEIFRITVDVVSVHIFYDVDTVVGEQITDVFKETNASLIVMQAVINDEVIGLWSCLGFEIGNTVCVGLIDLVGLNANIGKQAIGVDIHSGYFRIREIVPPNAQRGTGFSVFAHIGEAAGVIGANSTFKDVCDFIAAMVEDQAVEVRIGVWFPLELGGFRAVCPFIAAIDIAKLGQVTVCCWRIKRLHTLSQLLLYRCARSIQFGFWRQLAKHLVEGERVGTGHVSVVASRLVLGKS